MKRRTLYLILAAALVALSTAFFVLPLGAQVGNCPVVTQDQLVKAVTIPEDGCRTFLVRDYQYLTVIVADGGAATISRVDDHDATEHSETTSTVAASGSEDFDVFVVDWPIYRVSVVDAAARVGAAPRTVK